MAFANYVIETNKGATRFSAPGLAAEENPHGDKYQEYQRKLRNALKRLTGNSVCLGGVLVGDAVVGEGHYGVANKHSDGGMHPNGKFTIKKLG